MAAFHDLPHEAKLECLRELAASALANYGLAGASPPVLINLSENATYRIEDPSSGASPWVHREAITEERHRLRLAWLVLGRRRSDHTGPVPGGRRPHQASAIRRWRIAERRLVQMGGRQEPSEKDHLTKKKDSKR
jgi:hypothetical protein